MRTSWWGERWTRLVLGYQPVVVGGESLRMRMGYLAVGVRLEGPSHLEYDWVLMVLMVISSTTLRTVCFGWMLFFNSWMDFIVYAYNTFEGLYRQLVVTYSSFPTSPYFATNPFKYGFRPVYTTLRLRRFVKGLLQFEKLMMSCGHDCVYSRYNVGMVISVLRVC